MPGKFIPSADLAFDEMAQNFAGVIAADPERFGLSKNESEHLTRIVNRYREALGKSVHPGTKNKVAVVEKNQARAEAEELVRMYANAIRGDTRISRGERVSLGIKDRPEKLQKRKCPQTPPVLDIVGSERAQGSKPATHRLTFRHKVVKILGQDESSRAKPAGAVGIQLFVDLVESGAPIPTRPGEFVGACPQFVRFCSRTPFEVKQLTPRRPMIAVYWARWADATGEVGPFSETVEAGLVGATGPALEHKNTRRVSDDRLIELRGEEFRERYLDHVNVDEQSLLAHET